MGVPGKAMTYVADALATHLEFQQRFLAMHASADNPGMYEPVAARTPLTPAAATYLLLSAWQPAQRGPARWTRPVPRDILGATT